jgi:SAM-dependent methyltransferase
VRSPRAFVTAHRDRLPVGVRRALRVLDNRLDPLAIALWQRRTGDHRPIPPVIVRERNQVHSVGEWRNVQNGTKQILLGALELAGRDINEFERVLDFGCGAGKALTALYGTVHPELHGTDTHQGSIDWLRRNFPQLHVATNGDDPPLEYPDNCFGLLFAFSVMTHWREDRTDRWLAEWQRIVEPDGIALVTLASPTLLDRWIERGDAPPAAREELAHKGVYHLPLAMDGAASHEYVGTKTGYVNTFRTEDFWRDRIERYFEVLHHEPGFAWSAQDMVILRPRP